MLYMQLFCEENGLELTHLYLCKAFRWRTVGEVREHGVTRRRELNGVAPTEVNMVARKVNDRTGTLVLQQAEYEEKWSGNAEESTFVNRLKEILPWETQCVLKHYGLIWQSRKILRKIKL